MCERKKQPESVEGRESERQRDILTERDRNGKRWRQEE